MILILVIFPPLPLGLICCLLPQIFRSFNVTLNSVLCHILTAKDVHFGKAHRF